VPVGNSAKRYAQAAFSLALEHGSIDQWAEGLSWASEAASDPDCKSLLQHAKVPLSNKVKAVNDVFQSTDPLLRNLLCILVARGLVAHISAIEHEFRALLDRHRGRVRVDVTSAVSLDDAESERISKFLKTFTKKDVVISATVDPSILGGLVVRIEDKLIDGSTRTQLNGLRRSITGSSL
jgi:F-type H+-transporting ATPase subunit delta